MRIAFAVVLLFGVTGLIAAQPPKEPEPRYNIKPRLKQYPQTSPKEVLKSAVAAIETADYAYLVAQLLDPKFVDDAVAERTKLFEGGTELELARLRDYQRANPNKVTPENRVPLDPKAFREMAALKAREYAFKQLLKDIQQKLADDPQVLKDFRRFLRGGWFVDAAPAGAATHPDIKGRTLYFKKIDTRWYLENRQTEEKKEP